VKAGEIDVISEYTGALAAALVRGYQPFATDDRATLVK
jgi:hypothetical protein